MSNCQVSLFGTITCGLLVWKILWIIGVLYPQTLDYLALIILFIKKDKIFEYLYFKVHFLAKNITFRKYWIKFERKSPKREFLIKC